MEGGRLHRLLLKLVQVGPVGPFSSRPIRAVRDNADLKCDLGGLELKLHEVHFAIKFSEAEVQPRLRRT